MDGAFYRDMARSLPLTHLKQWATDYYLQYPAVTVLFYPPCFALVEALFFAYLACHTAVAQLTVSVFFLATAYGTYFLTRRWVSRLAAFSTALLFIGTPGMALWGRQVMLEIPAITFLVWSAYFFFRYLDSGRPRDLYLVAAFPRCRSIHKADNNFYGSSLSADALLCLSEGPFFACRRYGGLRSS